MLTNSRPSLLRLVWHCEVSTRSYGNGGSTSTSSSPVHSNGVNSHASINGKQRDEGADSDPAAKLQQELEK
jgi:hypothetical protein